MVGKAQVLLQTVLFDAPGKRAEVPLGDLGPCAAPDCSWEVALRLTLPEADRARPLVLEADASFLTSVDGNDSAGTATLEWLP